MFNKLKDYWHNFKIWFCKEEVDFFLKQIERFKFIVEQKNVLLESINKLDAKAMDAVHQEVSALKAEKLAMLSIDPAKIVRIGEEIVEENGKPVKKKIITIGNEQLSPEMSKILKEEIAFVKRTVWWTLVQATLGETARQNMFEQSKDYCDMHKGKATLYNLRLEKDIMDKIENA